MLWLNKSKPGSSNTLFDDEEEVIKEDDLDKSQDQSPK